MSMERPVRKRNLAIGSMIASAFLSAAFQIPAQSPPATSSATRIHKPEFDVASVKENKSGAQPTSNIPLDRSDTYSPTGGNFSATGQPLIAYLIFAYKVNVSETYGGLMRRLPEWAVADRFDIQAKSVNQNPTKDQLRLMMQSLLEDRFKLAVHRENRQVPVFALTLVKSGSVRPQLKRHDEASSCSTRLSEPSASARTASLIGLWPAACGDGVQIWLPGVPRHVRSGGRNMSMDAIASWLSGAGDLDLPIVNDSGLNGTFDFILEFEPEYPESNPSNAPIEGPVFIDAIRDQLGLQLKKQMGTSSFFIVDHVEYPSPN